MSKPIENLKEQSGKLGRAWGDWVVKNKWLALGLSLLFVGTFFTGMPKVGFDGDYHSFFKDDYEPMLAFDALQRKYTKDDNVLIVIESKDGKMFTKETLAAIEELTDSAWQLIPYNTRVDAITNFQHTYAEGDDLYVEDLVEDAESKSEAEITKIKKIALNKPLLVDRLLNESGSVSALNITVQLPGVNPTTEMPEIVTAVRGLTSRFENRHPELTTHLSGMVMLNGAFFEATQGDMGLMMMMFLAIIVMLLIASRTLSGTFATLIVIMFSIIAAMGFSGLAGIKLTPPSGSAPVIVMTLAVADSVHILITIVQYMRRGMNKKEAIAESLRVNFMPVFITSLTTVIGFLSMNTSEVPPFHDLGNITAVGMIGAFVFSITTLPALLTLLPMRVKVREEKEVKGGKIFSRIAEFVIAKRRQVLFGSAAIIIGFTVLSLRNSLNDEFLKYFDESVEFRSSTDFISDNLTGIYNVEYSLNSGEAGGINNPEYLKNLVKFEQWLLEQEEVIHVNSYVEVARQVNQSMHGDSAEYYRIPTDREAAAQYLLLYEMSLPFGLDLNNQINVDKSESRMIVTIENLTSNEMIAFAEKSEAWLKANTPEYMHTNGISPTMMFAYLGIAQILSMISGTALALILISIVLMFALKSTKFGILSLIPNIAPVVVGFGLWALLDGVINVGLAVVFGMTLGIIVDDTVHFMSKYLRARRDQNASPEDAVRYAFSTVGRALLVTSLVLVVGFTILSTSTFKMNSGMAQITGIIIVAALVIDFLMLPALLIALDKRKDKTNLIED